MDPAETSPFTDRNVPPGHIDKRCDEARRRLETKLLEDMEKSIAAIGEGPARGLTPSSQAQQVLRFSSYDPPRRRNAPSIQQSSYGAREKCRFEGGDQQKRMGPARTRSLTPDGGVRKGVRPADAAGAASNNPRRYDTPAGRDEGLGQTSRRTTDYHRRYHENAVGTTLPGPRAAQVESSPRKVRNVEAASKFTTSKVMREGLRYHLVDEGGSPERSMGKRNPNMGVQLSSPRGVAPAGAAAAGAAPAGAASAGATPATPRNGPARWNGTALGMFSDKRAQERGGAAVSSTLAPNQTVYQPPARTVTEAPKDDVVSPQKRQDYVPGSNDSMSARRRQQGTNVGTSMPRDIWGRDAFATTLRT